MKEIENKESERILKEFENEPQTQNCSQESSKVAFYKSSNLNTERNEQNKNNMRTINSHNLLPKVNLKQKKNSGRGKFYNLACL